MKSIKCKFFEPSTKVKRYFRRYEEGTCPSKYGRFHNAKNFRDEIEVPVSKNGYENDERMVGDFPTDELIPSFPTKCDYCDFEFTEKSEFQLNAERLYFCRETNEYFTLKELPAGAMYYADWMLVNRTSNLFRGPDGHCLVVIVPQRSPWMVDSRANNCTLPDDTEHKCWVRHGEVPNITVDKNGITCGAGGGSIQTGNYHGFLRNGYLEEC